MNKERIQKYKDYLRRIQGSLPDELKPLFAESVTDEMIARHKTPLQKLVERLSKEKNNG